MSRRIATLWDSNKDNDNEQPPDERGNQAFYVGGSQFSGQQVLGPESNNPNNHPPSSSRLVENLFSHARQSGALAEDQSGSHSSGRAGETTLPIRFWRNGFTIGDEEKLNDYDAPENRQFLEMLKRGETPPELANRVRGGIVDVKLENKASSDYVPERKFKAFSGEGRRLG